MALTDSLIAYWKLDEASGNATDSAGANTLTDNNSCGSGTGKINTARSFVPASSQFLNRADNADLSTGDIDFTLAAWVKFTNVVTCAVIMKIGAAGTAAVTEYGMRCDAGGGGGFYVQVGNGVSTTLKFDATVGVPSPGVWYYVVIWHDSVNNVIGITVNDGASQTAAHSTGVLDGAAGFSIGRFGDFAGLYFDGLIDEVGFWKRVLTSNERTALYNSGNGFAYPFTTAATSTRIGRVPRNMFSPVGRAQRRMGSPISRAR